MADILAHVFKTFTSQSELASDNVVPGSAPALSTLVVGEHALSRSVLLQAAVTAASKSGLRVTFFTQTQIQSLPVALQRRIPSLNPGTLKKIKFCYPRTLEELLVQVAGLHESLNMSSAPPALIIVDGLEGYLSTPTPSTTSGLHTSEQSSTAHLSGLLCDTASFLTQVLEKQGSSSAPCRVIISFQPQEGAEQKSGEHYSADHILDVLDRYFKVRCTLDQDRSYEATVGGLRQVWNIYLSGSGMTSFKKDSKEKPEVQEWKLLVSADGLMEFKLAPQDCV